MQVAIFMWISTKAGDMWVHYGTYKRTEHRRHVLGLKARQPNLELLVIDLPAPDAKAIEASNV